MNSALGCKTLSRCCSARGVPAALQCLRSVYRGSRSSGVDNEVISKAPTNRLKLVRSIGSVPFFQHRINPPRLRPRRPHESPMASRMTSALAICLPGVRPSAAPPPPPRDRITQQAVPLDLFRLAVSHRSEREVAISRWWITPLPLPCQLPWKLSSMATCITRSTPASGEVGPTAAIRACNKGLPHLRILWSTGMIAVVICQNLRRVVSRPVCVGCGAPLPIEG